MCPQKYSYEKKIGWGTCGNVDEREMVGVVGILIICRAFGLSYRNVDDLIGFHVWPATISRQRFL